MGMGLCAFGLNSPLHASSSNVLGIHNPALEQAAFGKRQCDLEGFAFSDPVSIGAVFNDWRGDYHPRSNDQYFWGFAETGIGFRQKTWFIRAWHRQSLLAAFDRSTSEVLHITKQELPLPLGKTFPVRLSLEGQKRTGLSLGHVLSGAGSGFQWSLGGDVSLWTSNEVQDGSLSGTVQVEEKNKYSYQLQADYRYTHNYLYELDVPNSKGLGLGLDVGLLVETQGWRFEAAVRDLGNRTYWKRLPLSCVNAVSDRSHVDSSGYQVFDPTVNGLETQRDWVQKTSALWMLQASMDNTWPISGSLLLEGFGNLRFLTGNINRGIGNTQRISLGYETRTKSWALGWSRSNLECSLIFDNPLWNRSSSVGIRVSTTF